MSVQQPTLVENVRRTDAKLFCRRCNNWKLESEFYKKSGKYRKEYACKKCVNIKRRAFYLENREYKLEKSREYRLKNRERVLHGKRRQVYGIDEKTYNKMLKEQNFVCAVCKNPETSKVNKGPNADKTNSLAVDHDHSTGKIRGLLCNRCNRALGYLKDNINLIYSLAEYKMKHQKLR